MMVIMILMMVIIIIMITIMIVMMIMIIIIIIIINHDDHNNCITCETKNVLIHSKIMRVLMTLMIINTHVDKIHDHQS